MSRDYSRVKRNYSSRERDSRERGGRDRHPRERDSRDRGGRDRHPRERDAKRKRFSDESAEDFPHSNKKQTQMKPETITINETDEKVPVVNFRVSRMSSDALARDGITTLFPIQVNTFDYAYDGRDIIGRARTGTGKTLSFSLPVIEKLIATKHRSKTPAVIVLAPTRELAKQVEKVMRQVSCDRLTTLCIYGGTNIQNQISKLYRGIDIIVGTPGRVLDLIDRGALQLGDIKYFILDEADDMLNMGFFKDIEKIFSHIKSKDVQTMLYSATMPGWVKEIAEQYLQPNYVVIDLVGNSQENVTAVGVDHYRYTVPYSNPDRIMKAIDVLIQEYSEGGKTMIFVNTKKECTKVAGHPVLRKLTSQLLHGGMQQPQRERTLKRFRDGLFRVLVCTDVAARGLDIDDIKLVIQYGPPRDAETYVHRSGRTGRAGNTGVCITIYERTDFRVMDKIERYAKFTFKEALPGVTIDFSTLIPDDFQGIKQDLGVNKYSKSARGGLGGRGGYNNRGNSNGYGSGRNDSYNRNNENRGNSRGGYGGNSYGRGGRNGYNSGGNSYGGYNNNGGGSRGSYNSGGNSYGGYSNGESTGYSNGGSSGYSGYGNSSGSSYGGRASGGSSGYSGYNSNGSSNYPPSGGSSSNYPPSGGSSYQASSGGYNPYGGSGGGSNSYSGYEGASKSVTNDKPRY